MRINLKSPVLNYESKPIYTEDENKPLTLFDVFVQALNVRVDNEIIPAEAKAKIYQITTKIYKDKEPNFTPDQLQLIKERVGKTYAPLIYGRVAAIIDGTEDAPAPIVEEKKEAITIPEPAPLNTQEENTTN